MFCFSRTPCIKPAGALLGISGLCCVHVCLTASLLIALFALLFQFQPSTLANKLSNPESPQQTSSFKIQKTVLKGKEAYVVNSGLQDSSSHVTGLALPCCGPQRRPWKALHVHSLPGTGLLQTVAVSHSNLLWPRRPSQTLLTRAIPAPQRCRLCCVASEWGAVKGTGRRLWVHA